MITPLEILDLVAIALQELREDVVFVGGAITGLLLTDPAAPSISPTKDVDVIVSVTTYAEYLQNLGGDMRQLGFREDTDEDAPICRWRLGEQSIKLDLMPTDPRILGFSNPWFEAAFEHAAPTELPSGTQIRIATAPYFLATKLEAFASRGNSDYMASKDMEDIVAVLHGRKEVVGEILASSERLRSYLTRGLGAFLSERDFLDALGGHLPGEDLGVVTERIQRLVDAAS